MSRSDDTRAPCPAGNFSAIHPNRSRKRFAGHACLRPSENPFSDGLSLFPHPAPLSAPSAKWYKAARFPPYKHYFQTASTSQKAV
ncbi:hypothetical protein [Kingella potus]|uniref:hypothetical protein n=1 Tax=Kingella potus TaxID=265175 RepID=UPI001FD578E8|nr:hypothetical protein [Kingella potus]UOO99997.1 hypothetical protein LVJ84_08205 [Kingella potus]